LPLHAILEGAKLVFIVAIAVVILLEYISPFAQRSLGVDFSRDSNVKEVLNLANMIRLITDDQLSEGKPRPRVKTRGIGLFVYEAFIPAINPTLLKSEG